MINLTHSLHDLVEAHHTILNKLIAHKYVVLVGGRISALVTLEGIASTILR